MWVAVFSSFDELVISWNLRDKKEYSNKLSKQRRQEIHTASKNVTKHKSICFPVSFTNVLRLELPGEKWKNTECQEQTKGKKRRGGCASLLEEETEL